MGKLKAEKKGDSKALSISHPNSRKAKALAKKVIKASTRDKIKSESAIKRNLLYGEKLVWFQENLEAGNEYSAEMLDELIEKYLRRFNEELEQIEIKQSIGKRRGRQHANRQDIINLTKQREHEEYHGCGIEMVDLLNPKQLKLFREWDGNLGVHFNIRRFSKSFLTKFKSTDPPKDAIDDTSTENMITQEENTHNEGTTNGSKEASINTLHPNEENPENNQTKLSMDIEENGM